MILIAIAIPVIVLVWKLYTNFQKWKKHIEPKHFKEWCIMAALCIPSIVIFGIKPPFSILLSLSSAIFICFFLWIFFDGLYNKMRNYGWWFTGSDDPEDAKTDNFLQSIPLWLHITIKLIGFLGGLILYIYFLKK